MSELAAADKSMGPSCVGEGCGVTQRLHVPNGPQAQQTHYADTQQQHSTPFSARCSTVKLEAFIQPPLLQPAGTLSWHGVDEATDDMVSFYRGCRWAYMCVWSHQHQHKHEQPLQHTEPQAWHLHFPIQRRLLAYIRWYIAAGFRAALPVRESCTRSDYCATAMRMHAYASICTLSTHMQYTPAVSTQLART